MGAAVLAVIGGAAWACPARPCDCAIDGQAARTIAAPAMARRRLTAERLSPRGGFCTRLPRTCSLSRVRGPIRTAAYIPAPDGRPAPARAIGPDRSAPAHGRG